MEKEKEMQMREGNISLILDSYDDIFSDFDPRPYSEKALSYDFLEECKRATRDKEAGIELRLLVPKQKRNINEELKITKRLKSHFNKHFHEEKKKMKSIKKEGLMWFFLGVVVMVAATFFYQQEGFLFNLLFIITEPASWFLFWEGLGKLFIEARKRIPDYEFYKKMKTASIIFLGYQ